MIEEEEEELMRINAGEASNKHGQMMNDEEDDYEDDMPYGMETGKLETVGEGNETN